MQINIYEVLPYLPLQNVKKHSGYISALCPFHQEKNNSFILYESGSGKCFSCGETFNIYSLTKRLLGKSLQSVLGIQSEYKSFLFMKKINNITKNNIENRFKIEDKTFEIKGSFLDVFNDDEVFSYLRGRHISNKFINDFKIKYCNLVTINKTLFKNRIIIPIYENKKLIAYEGRDYTRKQQKKCLYPRGSSVNTLFNMDNLDRDKPLIVVEGIMDLPLIYDNITKNVTSVFGIALTKRQVNLLNEFKEIILLPDNDEGGNRFISILDSMLDKEFYIASLKKSQDPGCSSLEEIKEAIDNRITSAEYFLDKYKLTYEKNQINW